MPLPSPAQLLGVVLKLIVIGFSSLFMGFLLTPATWHRPKTPPTYVADVQSYRDAVPEVAPAVTPTPVVPRSLATLDVRIGPSAGYVVIGSLPRGAKLEVVGRDPTGDWLAIVFSSGSGFNGWVPGLQVTDAPDLNTLPLAPVTFLP